MMKTNEQFTRILQSNLFRLDGPEIDILESLENLCECINNDSMETDWDIGECMDCTLADLIIGAYWALTECHEGQYSHSYAVMCSLGSIFTPNISSGPEEDTGEYIAYEMICETLTK